MLTDAIGLGARSLPHFVYMIQVRFCFLLHSRCNWPRGKVLGGSSVLNYMIYVRGNKRDYDRWAAEGNQGWSYDEVLPYFKKSEDNRNPYIAANTKYHSTGGYLTVEEPAYTTPLLNAFIEGGVEMGYSNIDANAAQQTGRKILNLTQEYLSKHWPLILYRFYENSIHHSQWIAMFDRQSISPAHPPSEEFTHFTSFAGLEITSQFYN